MRRVLLDTSVVIRGVAGSGLDPQDAVAISVITLGELRAGVRLATDDHIRAPRQARLAAVRDAFEPLPVDEAVADGYGELLALARSRRRASKATDLLIIATASATGRSLLTGDESQAGLAALAGVPLIGG